MPVVISKLVRLLNILTMAASVLAAIGLASIVGSYVFEVVSRYLFRAPTAWANDFVGYALCATVFLALPRVTKERTHVAVTILVENLPKPITGTIHVGIHLAGFLCLMFAAWVSLHQNIRQFTRGIETLAIVPIPLWWVSSFITFGLTLSAFHMLLHVPPRYRNTVSAATEQGN